MYSNGSGTAQSQKLARPVCVRGCGAVVESGAACREYSACVLFVVIGAISFGRTGDGGRNERCRRKLASGATETERQRATLTLKLAARECVDETGSIRTQIMYAEKWIIWVCVCLYWAKGTETSVQLLALIHRCDPV